VLPIGLGSVTFTYPIAFPTATDAIAVIGNGGATATSALTASPTANNAFIVNPGPNPAQTVFIIAIGH
jgi:hypothetical protein